MKLSQQDKGEDSYFKVQIKIQHIHSSPKLPVMVSTCWTDERGEGKRWDSREANEVERLDIEKRGMRKEDRGLLPNHFNWSDPTEAGLAGLVNLVKVMAFRKSWMSPWSHGRQSTWRGAHVWAASSLWRTRSGINAPVQTVSTHPSPPLPPQHTPCAGS